MVNNKTKIIAKCMGTTLAVFHPMIIGQETSIFISDSGKKLEVDNKAMEDGTLKKIGGGLEIQETDYYLMSEEDEKEYEAEKLKDEIALKLTGAARSIRNAPNLTGLEIMKETIKEVNKHIYKLYKNLGMKKYTPENIKELQPCEIFVFGSNERGEHYGGAARTAFERFGARWGIGEGFINSTYAIPTLDKYLNKVQPKDLENSIYRFIASVINNQHLTFYLTKIGCGIAGWKVEEVKELFWKAVNAHNPELDEGLDLPSNLIIPKEFDL